jgi:hypothetical protein
MINIQKQNWKKSFPLFSTFICHGQVTHTALEESFAISPLEQKKITNIDSPPMGKILLRYDMTAWKSLGINQQLFTFYNEKGIVIKEFVSNRPPERSPYAKLEIPYFEENQKTVSPALIENLSTNGYFDLANLTFSSKKRIFKNAKINLPDSIVRNSEKIYHSPPSVEYFNEHCLLTNSVFGIVDKSKKSLWKSEHLTVYDYKFNIVHEKEITQELYSNDGLYLLLVQVRTHQNSEMEIDTADPWAEDIPNEDYDLPMKLIDLKNNTKTLIDVDTRDQPVTNIKYREGNFHIIFGGDTHAFVDIKNRKAYSKYYNERMYEPLLHKIELGLIDLSQYRAYSF